MTLIRKFFEHSKLDNATINSQTIKLFDEKWSRLETRMEIVPGKDVLRRLRDVIQTKYSVNLTDNKLIDEIHISEVPDDLKNLLTKLEAYRNAS